MYLAIISHGFGVSAGRIPVAGYPPKQLLEMMNLRRSTFKRLVSCHVFLTTSQTPPPCTPVFFWFVLPPLSPRGRLANRIRSLIPRITNRTV